MRRLLLVVAVGAIAVTQAAAQPIACEPCVRGDAVIERYGLQPIRAVADTLAAVPLDELVTQEQYARVIQLRVQTPALVKLGALEPADLDAIAAALCHTASGPCTTATARTLTCLADRCAVQLPLPPPGKGDLITEDCHRYSTKHRSSAFGVGFDWGSGVLRSKYPTDGRAWSLGIASRVRFGRRLGAIARVDRVAARDEATDTDDNGTDDASTGSITRFSALAGPTILLDQTRYEDLTRSLRLDLLGGYVATRSQVNESGIAAGVDLAFELSMFRLGARLVQGFGDAQSATSLVVHMGLFPGGGPPPRNDDDCGAEPATRSSPFGLGFDVPLGGYGISEQLGFLATGLAFEALARLSRKLDAVARVDLLLFPGDERERVIHQAALAGLRVDHGARRHEFEDTGFFSTYMVGYSHGAGLTPTTTGSGPIADLAIGWGIMGREGAANFRLHARFGISPDNVEYRAIFLSGSAEIHLDPASWRNSK